MVTTLKVTSLSAKYLSASSMRQEQSQEGWIWETNIIQIKVPK